MRLRNQSIYIPMNTTSRSVNVSVGKWFILSNAETGTTSWHQISSVRPSIFKKKSVKNTLSVGENTNDLFTQTFVQLCRDVR